MSRESKTILANIDWVLVILFLVFAFSGWLNIYAATYDPDNPSLFDFSQSYGKQLIWIGAAIVLGVLVLFIDGGFFKSLSWVFYALAIGMLAFVLIGGTEIKGAKSWFTLGSISLQPSEFAKYATALALAKYLADREFRRLGMTARIQTFAIIGLPAVLIALQPDMGSVLVYASLCFVLYREGLSGNILLIGLLAAVLFILTLILKNTAIPIFGEFAVTGEYIMLIFIGIIIAAFYRLMPKRQRNWRIHGVAFAAIIGMVSSVGILFDKALGAHQQNRINELLGITSDPSGAGYNVAQSKIAIGSGGFSGKGFLQGTQTKFDFVPEQSTDFIFCTVGEEWGFVGSFIVIGLFLTLLTRLIYIAERQRSKFARVYGYAVMSIFFFHLLINVGMTIGLAPVIGIPLPFFSYGGSSLWSFSLLLFTMIKLDAERKMVLR